MNAKFKLGDSVYWSNNHYIVVSPPLFSVYGVRYLIQGNNSLLTHEIFEINLESEDEHAKRHMGSQNSVGRAAFEHKYGRVSEFKLKEKSCVCGAHKVKDSRHSTWCEIKD